MENSFGTLRGISITASTSFIACSRLRRVIHLVYLKDFLTCWASGVFKTPKIVTTHFFKYAITV